ncbi:MAG: TIGR02147 family protein [Spirochaetota bacterium]
MQRSIYTYTDYREFIRDSYAAQKAEGKVTLREFARKAGFNTHTFIANVMDNKRSLTSESAGKVARGLGLKAAERTYLELMVKFANARTTDEKNDYYEQMCAAMPRSEIRKIGSEYYEIFRYPYVLTIRELVALPDFREDAKWIARQLRPQITTQQAERALQTLIDAKLLERDRKGRLVQASADLTTGAEVRSLAVALYHKELLALAARSIDETPAKNRDISSLTLNLGKSDFDFIKRRTAAFRAELLDFLKKKRDDNPEGLPYEKDRSIYYLNMQFFNATEIPW